MFSSLCLLTPCIFSLPPSFPSSPPSTPLSVKAKASPQMGVFITKKSTKEPAVFQAWQVNGISAETRREIISKVSACFHGGGGGGPTQQGNKRGRMQQSTEKREKCGEIWLLYWRWYWYLTHSVSLPCSVGKARHFKGYVEGEGFPSWHSSVAWSAALTLAQIRVYIPPRHPHWLYHEGTLDNNVQKVMCATLVKQREMGCVSHFVIVKSRLFTQKGAGYHYPGGGRSPRQCMSTSCHGFTPAEKLLQVVAP